MSFGYIEDGRFFQEIVRGFLSTFYQEFSKILSIFYQRFSQRFYPGFTFLDEGFIFKHIEHNRGFILLWKHF